MNMVDLIMGAKVINKAGEKGTIVSLENNYIKVDFVSRVATLQQDAFEKGFLKYENAELQNTVVKIIEQAKIEEERKIEQVRIVAEKAKQEIKPKQAKRTEKISNDKDISVKVNLDASPVNLNSIGTKDKEFFQKLFNECDKDIKTLFDLFDPKMAYYKYTSRSRSKYSVGFLTKYLDTYVFRVFMRNDIYKKGIRTGITILQSDSTEILRIICLNGKVFYFSKNISLSMGFYNISRSFNKWHDTSMAEGVILNDVIRKCDCKYLNDYISEKKINCYQYTKLLFPALENSKVEIVFKNKLFLATYRITDLVEYFEKFSSKQIDFASKNNVINTLPIIKDYGVLDIDILQDMEKIMKKQSYHNSIYDTLLEAFKRLNFDYTDLGKRLIGFLEKVDSEI